MICNVNDRIGTGLSFAPHVEIMRGTIHRIADAPRELYLWLMREGDYSIDAPEEMPAGGCKPYEEPELMEPGDPPAAEQLTTWRE